MRPAIFEYLADYTKIGKTRRLLNRINEYWHSICKDAVNYSSMSEHMRKLEQAKWLKRESGSDIGDSPCFAIPMCNPTERIRDCSIDDFEFSWLKTSVDYDEAGKALHNCLEEWTSHNYPVICVRKGGKIIAALEIRNNSVFQAFTSHNDSLRKIPGLLKAYRMWHTKNNLSDKYFPLYARYYGNDDRLPF